MTRGGAFLKKHVHKDAIWASRSSGAWNVEKVFVKVKPTLTRHVSDGVQREGLWGWCGVKNEGSPGSCTEGELPEVFGWVVPWSWAHASDTGNKKQERRPDRLVRQEDLGTGHGEDGPEISWATALCSFAAWARKGAWHGQGPSSPPTLRGLLSLLPPSHGPQILGHNE